MSNSSQNASNASMENILLSMQRLELNLTKSMETVLNRLNTFETKMETMQRQFADYQNGQTQALTKSLTGVAEQLQKVTAQALQFASSSGPPSYVPKPPEPEPVKPNVPATSEKIKCENEPKVSNDVKPQSSQSFGAHFNIKEGEWDCQTCYVRNKPTSSTCVSCGSGEDVEEKSSHASAFKPTSFATNSAFSSGTGQPLFGVKTAAPSEWDCETCYARNEPSSSTCDSCGTGKNAEEKSTSHAPKPTSFAANSTFSFGTGKTLFGVKPAPPSSHIKVPTDISPAKLPESKSSFGGGKAAFSFAPSSSSSPFSSPAVTSFPATNLSNKTPLSFASFASGSNFLDKKPSTTDDNSFGAQKSHTFQSAPANETHEDNENPEEYVPDVHYEPVVPLPDKVQVVTGEEAEQVLFKNRAKLYVFNSETKEVKERGVGDLKLLFNPETKTHRVVMRREQVHKLCANFRVNQGMSIADKTGSKNCGIFNCKDYSDDAANGKDLIFIVRFKDEDVYEDFKKLFMDIATGNNSPA